MAASPRAGLPPPAGTLSGPALGWIAPILLGAAIGFAIVWSDIASPVAAARSVRTVHVEGWIALPFYLYGALLISVVFHFLPIASAAWLASSLRDAGRFTVIGLASEVLQVRPGALYPALHRLEHQGWIVAKWAQTAAGRRAKYYPLTRAGRLQLERESKQWRRLSSAVTALLDSV